MAAVGCSHDCDRIPSRGHVRGVGAISHSQDTKGVSSAPRTKEGSTEQGQASPGRGDSASWSVCFFPSPWVSLVPSLPAPHPSFPLPCIRSSSLYSSPTPQPLSVFLPSVLPLSFQLCDPPLFPMYSPPPALPSAAIATPGPWLLQAQGHKHSWRAREGMPVEVRLGLCLPGLPRNLRLRGL